MSGPREQNIQSAIDASKSGEPLAQVCRDNEVPYATTWGRLHGATSSEEGRLRTRKLSPQEESFLVDWARNEEASGRPPTKQKLRRMAQSILKEGGVDTPLGKRWGDRFVTRHKSIRVKTSRPLDQQRRKGSTKEAYEDFFTRLKYQMTVKNIPPRYIANMDEHGMQETETYDGAKVIGDSMTSEAYRETTASTTWISVIECATAEGRSLTPCVIITGETLQGQWYPEDFLDQPQLRDWKFDHSPTGFSNARIALKWLREIFIPETRPKNPRQWRLLILDGASSHTTEDFENTAFANRIQLEFLPPHTSQKTQPLDRSVFGPLKQYFRDETALLCGRLTSSPVNKQRCMLAYQEARKKGFTAKNIRSGFRKCGIWPFNPKRILEDRQAVVGDSPPPPSRSPTPTNLPITSATVFKTPQKSGDIQNALRDALGYNSPTEPNVRRLLIKAGKALDTGNGQGALLAAENEQLRPDLEALKPRTKNKVKEPANGGFPRAEDIAEAEKASRKPPKSRKRKRAAEPAVEEEYRVEEVIHAIARFNEALESE